VVHTPVMLVMCSIRDDWSFDEAMARYGCQVHSFDPRYVSYSACMRACVRPCVRACVCVWQLGLILQQQLY